EYRQAMQLMDDHTSPNHVLIQYHYSEGLAAELLDSYENHHDVAGKRNIDGEKWIIHRKGATPSGLGVVGIIPGSMGTSSFLVEGKAGRESLWSAAHGAGRISSRTQAKKNHDEEAYQRYVQEKDILTIRVAKIGRAHV